MFPDPSLRWRPYPSMIDGIERPPYVFDQGFWRGVLHLIVVGPKNVSQRAYGIELSCEVYSGIEEMIYSIADHGDGTSRYGGGVYIKEAERSALLDAYAALDPARRKPRHFLFVGGDYCFEALGFSDPIIRAFRSPDEAYAWRPQTTSVWEEIHGFASPGVYTRFVQYLREQVAAGAAREVPADPLYASGIARGGSWFQDVQTGAVWRLVPPDPPFAGVWEPVATATR